MTSRGYIVGVLVFVLLIWGPIDHSWPAWFLIRTGYLIAIPGAAWFLLGWIWKMWQPDAVTEDRLARALGAATAGVLLVGAMQAATSDSHTGNNWVLFYTFIVLAGVGFWFSIAKRGSEQ